MKKLNQTKLFNKQNLEKNLQLEYMKASMEEEFKKYISKTNLKEEELMRYTSKIQNCVKEDSNCKNCKKLEECKNEIYGFKQTLIEEDNKVYFDYLACKYKKQDIKEKNKNIYLSEVPKEIANAKMKDIYINDKNRKEIIIWLQKFIKDYQKEKNKKGLYLHGNFGCGKTYLISAALNELSKKNIKTAMVYFPEFLRNLKASFDDDFNEKFETAKKAEILFIDDIGAENVTTWSRDEILAPILQYRMESNLTTFFTSNLSLEDLEVHLSSTRGKVDLLKSKRIMERINKLTEEKEMNSLNLRK